MSNFLLDLKLAARTLAKRPTYAAVAAFTLALGIGANVAIFTVVNAVLLRPLPFPEANRIVEIRHHAPAMKLPHLQGSPGLIARYREHARTLTRVGGYDILLLNLAGVGTPERIRAVAVTPDLFDVLATHPALGRRFTSTDAQQHASRVVILTHDFWQVRFGGSQGVIGRTIQLDGESAQVVGVMPKGFVFPDQRTQLLVPLWLDPKGEFGAFGIGTIGRLRPGVTLDAARREIEQLQRRIPEWFPDIGQEGLNDLGWSVTLAPLRDRLVADVSRTLWLLFATVAVVLLIAGANVANLFLVRAESRQREIAVRSALGASRARIARAFLAESLVLAMAGGIAGLWMAAAVTALLVAYGPSQLPRLHEVRMDATVVAFAAGVSLMCAVLLGVLPIVGIARRPFAALVRDGGRTSTAGRGRQRLRKLLIVTQVAMALVLLVASGLMLRSVVRLNSVDPGFRPDGLVTVGVSLGPQRDRARAVAFYQQILDQIAAVPGVSAVGAASSLPVAATSMTGSDFAIKSRPTPDSELPPFAMYSAVTPAYFETLGVPLIEGRLPTRSDAEQGRAVAWVNRTLAREFLGGRAVGESIQVKGTWLEIVGVVGDLRTFGLRDEIRPLIYITLSNTALNPDVMYLVVRSERSAASLAPVLRAAVDRVNATVPLTTVRGMDEVVAESVAQTSFTMTLLAIASGVALLLGVVGLYGVINYIVAQRTSEIGIRLALGAEPSSVRAMVLRQGLAVAVIGVVVGLAAAWASTRVMTSLLFEVSARDPLTFATAALVLSAVSALATYIPARRASAIDPLRALREEG